MTQGIKIGNKTIGANAPVFIIADIGANHNGSLQQAKKLIRLAARCNVDAVKFQSYRLEYFISKKYNPKGYEIIKKYQLPLEWNKILKNYCENQGVLFMTTPFDVPMVDYLEKLDIYCYKIASGDINFKKLLERVAATQKPVIVSTGGSQLGEIKNAVNIFQKSKSKIILLHAVLNYPCSYKEINLNFMPRLGKIFSLPYGLSDHSPGIEVALASVALGAKVIEKHFTENRKQKGPDHKHSIMPDELCNLIKSVRNIEESLGKATKRINLSELRRLCKARRSIYAIRDIEKGEHFNVNNVRELRPNGPLSPERMDSLLKRTAVRQIKNGERIEAKDLK